MKTRELIAIIVVALAVVAIIGGIILAIYENGQHNRIARQQKYNTCIQAGGSPVVITGDQTICMFSKH